MLFKKKYSLAPNRRGVGIVGGLEKCPKPNKRWGGWKIALKFNGQGVLKKLLNSTTFLKPIIANNKKQRKRKMINHTIYKSLFIFTCFQNVKNVTLVLLLKNCTATGLSDSTQYYDLSVRI